jgi:hypothetical protein
VSHDLHCWRCGASLADLALPFGRQERCRGCGADLHACRLCVSHDRQAPDQCREDKAEPPRDRERANFCDWYKPRGGARATAADDAAAAAKAALDKLFGG